MRSIPPASIQPIEPPPAPIVWMPSMGRAMRWRLISPSFTITGESTANEASKLVPPMSTVMHRLNPCTRA